MGHDEAVQTQLVEKYLLGQMAAGERDRFEEHFFDCELCAEEIRTGLLLMDNAAAEFAAEPAPRRVPDAAPVARRKRSRLSDWFRFDWRQPAFVMPALALVAVSGLWVSDHARLDRSLASATEPQVITTEQLDVTRGDTPLHVNRNERYFAFTFYIDTDKDTLPDYLIEIQGNGVAPATISVPQRALGKGYEVLLPTARYKPGRYEFSVRGGPGTDGRIVKQFERKLD